MPDPAGTGVSDAPHGAAAHRAARPSDRRSDLLRRGVAALFVFVVACLVTAPVNVYEIHSYHALSPIDETADLDALHLADHGHFIVGQGQLNSAFTARVLACRGIANASVAPKGFAVPPRPAQCVSTAPLSSPLRDTADIDPPTYYVVTDLGVKVLRGLGVTSDLLQAGRLMGIFWGGLGLSLLFLLARLLGARRLPAALVCLAALLDEGIVLYWAHVTPHAADVAVGAFAAIVGVQWLKGRWPTWTMVLAGGVPVMFKASDAVVSEMLVLAALVAAYLTHRAGRQQDGAPEDITLAGARGPAGYVAGGGATLLGLGAVSGVLVLIRRHYQLSPIADYASEFHVTALHLSNLFDTVGAFAVPLATGAGGILSFWALGSTVRFATDDRELLVRRSLAVALVPMVIFGAWSFVLSNYVLLHEFYLISTRYGLSLAPTTFGFAAVNMKSRWVQVAGIVVVVMLGWTLFHHAE